MLNLRTRIRRYWLRMLLSSAELDASCLEAEMLSAPRRLAYTKAHIHHLRARLDALQ